MREKEKLVVAGLRTDEERCGGWPHLEGEAEGQGGCETVQGAPGLGVSPGYSLDAFLLIMHYLETNHPSSSILIPLSFLPSLQWPED